MGCSHYEAHHEAGQLINPVFGIMTHHAIPRVTMSLVPVYHFNILEIDGM
jgi:hypothetical protein